MVTLVRDITNAAFPTARIAPGTTEDEPVISDHDHDRQRRAGDTAETRHHAHHDKMPGSWGTTGSPESSPSRQMAAPTKAPITIPGPNSPPDPPVSPSS
jgi:hypothetical protein